MKLFLCASGVALITGTGNALAQHSVAVGMVSTIFLLLFLVLPREAVRWKRRIVFLLKPKTGDYYRALMAVQAPRR